MKNKHDEDQLRCAKVIFTRASKVKCQQPHYAFESHQATNDVVVGEKFQY